MPYKKYAQALCWVDLETSGLDENEDALLEIGLIVTDFDLKPYFGYEEVFSIGNGAGGIDPKVGASLKRNPEVIEMHKKNGLLKEALASTKTVADADAAIDKMLTEKASFEKGEYMLAGSGVAAFDRLWIKKHMPKLDSWLAYYPFDIGIVRRMARILSGGATLINPVGESFGSSKAHRGLADVKAHIKEADEFKKFFHWAAEKQLAEK